MTLYEAVAHLAHVADIKLALANAPRRSEHSAAIAEKHRKDATAIALVLAALPEGAVRAT